MTIRHAYAVAVVLVINGNALTATVSYKVVINAAGVETKLFSLISTFRLVQLASRLDLIGPLLHLRCAHRFLSRHLIPVLRHHP